MRVWRGRTLKKLLALPSDLLTGFWSTTGATALFVGF